MIKGLSLRALATVVFVAGAMLAAALLYRGRSGVETTQGITAAQTMIRDNPNLDLVETDEEAGTITVRNNKTGEIATLNFEDIAEGKFSVTTDEGDFSVDASVDGEEGSVTIKGPEGETRFGATSGDMALSLGDAEVDATSGDVAVSTTDQATQGSEISDGEEGGVTKKGPEGETHIGASVDLDDVPDWVPLYPGMTETQSTLYFTPADGVMGAFTGKTSDDARKVVDYYKKHFEDEGYTIQAEALSSTPQGDFGSIVGELSGRTVTVGVVESEGEVQVDLNYNVKKE